MYDPNLYGLQSVSDIVVIESGAYLYRITSENRNAFEFMLNGGGPLSCDNSGRFHFAHQRTTYCANNALITIAEVLYHMYRTALHRVMANDPIVSIEAAARRDACFTLARVRRIDSLLNLESEQFLRDNGPRFGGTMAVHPDKEYREFQTLAARLREQGMRGLAYPSARHWQDVCFVLFRDETGVIEPSSFRWLQVRLQLVRERQDQTKEPEYCRPDLHKLHPTLGFYRFKDPQELEALRRDGVLNPADLPEAGYLEFVRRPRGTL
jgi:RES domain